MIVVNMKCHLCRCALKNSCFLRHKLWHGALLPPRRPPPPLPLLEGVRGFLRQASPSWHQACVLTLGCRRSHFFTRGEGRRPERQQEEIWRTPEIVAPPPRSHNVPRTQLPETKVYPHFLSVVISLFVCLFFMYLLETKKSDKGKYFFFFFSRTYIYMCVCVAVYMYIYHMYIYIFVIRCIHTVHLYSIHFWLDCIFP